MSIHFRHWKGFWPWRADRVDVCSSAFDEKGPCPIRILPRNHLTVELASYLFLRQALFAELQPLPGPRNLLRGKWGEKFLDQLLWLWTAARCFKVVCTHDDLKPRPGNHRCQITPKPERYAILLAMDHERWNLDLARKFCRIYVT